MGELADALDDSRTDSHGTCKATMAMSECTSAAGWTSPSTNPLAPAAQSPAQQRRPMGGGLSAVRALHGSPLMDEAFRCRLGLGLAATANKETASPSLLNHPDSMSRVEGPSEGKITISSPPISLAVDPIFSKECAKIASTLRGQPVGVELFVAQNALASFMGARTLDMVERRCRWIRVQTVLQSRVAHFVDGTPSGKLGQPLSPFVYVDLEQQASGKPSGFEGDVAAVFPLCIGTSMDDRSAIAKGDFALCYSHWRTAEWVEVDATNFELLPLQVLEAYAVEAPACAVKLPYPGLVCAFSRMDESRRPRVRVRCVAYLPAPCSCLDRHRIRIYVCAALPEELELLAVREQLERGFVHRGGFSEVFELSYGERLDISVSAQEGYAQLIMSEKQGSNVNDSEGCDDQERALARARVLWLGTATFVDLRLDPEDLNLLALRRGVAEPDAKDVAPTLQGTLEVTVDIHDLRSQLRAPAKERAKIASDRPEGRQAHGPLDRGLAFLCAFAIQDFPPPSTPSQLSLVHRTSHSLAVAFRPPLKWGGCALLRHEVQLREVRRSQDGKQEGKQEGSMGRLWEHVQDLSASRPTVTRIARNVFMADIRIRSWNIACNRPSGWSEVLSIRTEKVLGDSTPSPHDTAPPTEGRSKSAVVAAARAEEATRLMHARSSVEGGVASLIHDSLGERFMVKHVMHGDALMSGQGWPRLRTAIGSCFVEVGVFGGCLGKLFDFSAADAEQLILHSADPSLNAGTPLLSLAMIGCYAIQTSAQYAAFDRAQWAELANDVTMLVRLAIAASVNEHDEHIRLMSLLTGLIDLYETLLQCDEDGYIARQIGTFSYDERTERQLRSDWQGRLRRLKERVKIDVICFLVK